jgi:hypothetical protein
VPWRAGFGNSGDAQGRYLIVDSDSAQSAESTPGEGEAQAWVIASDLDRTLIYSLAACQLGDKPIPELDCVEFLDAEPLSFLTKAAGAALVALAEIAVFVPTTTRTIAQLARVTLPGRPAPYAVAANGGHLVVDGVPDPAWSQVVTRTLAESAVGIDEVWQWLVQVCEPAWTLKLRRADELFCYAVIDRAALPPAFLDEADAWCLSRGWRTSLQGRKLYLVPVMLIKSAAVKEVCRRVGATEFAAAGDSLLDAELLAAAVTGIRPAHGELDDLGWSAKQVSVTTGAGVAAGEEIATWLLQTARQQRPVIKDPVIHRLPVSG